MTYLITLIGALTAIYCLTIASFAWEDLVFGAVVATGLIAIFRRMLLPATLPDTGHVLHIILYTPVLLWMLFIDILKGTWLVTKYVVGIDELDHPGIVKIPLGQHSRAGVGIVSLLLTISPGSFLVDIDWEDSSMLVHFIDASNPVKLRRDVEKYYRIWEYNPPDGPGPDASDSGMDPLHPDPERRMPDA